MRAITYIDRASEGNGPVDPGLFRNASLDAARDVVPVQMHQTRWCI